MLEQIALHAGPEGNIVSVILDGENAWEYYPYNGFFFLDDLYTLLENHPAIGTTTYSDYIVATGHLDTIAQLPALTAGSWVYGSFSTWIGDRKKTTPGICCVQPNKVLTWSCKAIDCRRKKSRSGTAARFL